MVLERVEALGLRRKVKDAPGAEESSSAGRSRARGSLPSLVSVAVLEALAAAAGADVIAPDAGKVQRLRPAKRRAHGCRRARSRGLRRLRLGVLAGRGLLLSHRPTSYPKLAELTPRRPTVRGTFCTSCRCRSSRGRCGRSCRRAPARGWPHRCPLRRSAPAPGSGP